MGFEWALSSPKITIPFFKFRVNKYFFLIILPALFEWTGFLMTLFWGKIIAAGMWTNIIIGIYTFLHHCASLFKTKLAAIKTELMFNYAVDSFCNCILTSPKMLYRLGNKCQAL